MSIYDKTLNEYLDVAASDAPTPGGGSVSAIVATNAAAMVCMVANLTIGKKKYEEYEEQAKSIAAKGYELIDQLKDLTARDMAAFDAFVAAWRMPSETDAEKAAKAEANEKAAQNATTVPMEICKVCLEIMKLAKELAPFGNLSAISDCGVASLIAEGAMKACMLSVDINLPGLKTAEFADAMTKERARLFAEAEDLKIYALADVKARMSGH
ncbi:MAG: formimidoyltetrahydrofolate cyclodeaminase [Deltaproteobacteria bacterium]|nr:MAG: formimidoyltetrahydrofolate cyclodeaminase [Deltaproteobacteria bacterium]